ncbi:hypothetical protein [Actinokineospora sp. NBRC 105648]|uniref:hypothetical protein n=1 Tax=Actinokineospora sp. NBRC 105648 TaxID=3032206 RepID=UPI0024A31B9B|nr:hypothetical protein [Actinokineospora sp. NBRC 105648]GLZ39236.1 hypothetical protein Acsp05_28600 [Actinokineospora sp. NBRC 105648]
MTDDGWAPHGLRYYVVVFAILTTASLLVIFVLERATWAMAGLGAVTGGFIFDAMMDWSKHRKAK